MMMCHFRVQKGPICPEQIVFNYKPLLLLSFTYWPFSLCRIPLVNPELCGWQFWAQNGPFPQMIIFSENLLMSLVSFIHAFLHTKNQSQILIYKRNVDVERILKSHWRRAIFGYNLRTRFFPSMQFSQDVNEP